MNRKSMIDFASNEIDTVSNISNAVGSAAGGLGKFLSSPLSYIAPVPRLANAAISSSISKISR